VVVSARTGAGIGDLKRLVLERLGLAGFEPSKPAAFTARQESLLIAGAEAAEAGRQDECSGALDRLLRG
jgi:hypothetical protein